MSSTQELLQSVTALIEKGETWGLDLPVDTGRFSIDLELVRKIYSALGEASQILDAIGEAFDGGIPEDVGQSGSVPDETEGLREIAAGISMQLASREVADLANVGSADLSRMRQQLGGGLAQENFWQLASLADGALGRLGRALIPVESALREYCDLPPKRRRWEDLDDSLEIRRQYGLLWRAVMAGNDPRTGADLQQSLATVANRISILRMHTIYPFLRIDDRLALRRLQKRLLAFLHRPGPADEIAGRRLWNDVVSSFRLLLGINGRQELMDHDRELVLTCFWEISRRRRDGSISPEMRQRLQPLLGRDEDLDRVLFEPTEHPEDYLRPLERLQHELLERSSTAMRL